MARILAIDGKWYGYSEIANLLESRAALLEALEALVAWNELNVPYDNKAVDKARAAIKLARGGESDG